MLKRDWNTVGLPVVKNVRKMHLYTDKPLAAESTQIAVIWHSQNRTGELLVMTPVPVARIELRQDGVFKPL